MKITLASRVAEGIPSAIVVKGRKFMLSHPALAHLDTDDLKYMTAYSKSLPAEGDFSRYVILPSGTQLLLLGIGGSVSPHRQILIMRRCITEARSVKVEKLQIFLDDFLSDGGDINHTAQCLAVQTQMANFEFHKYKSNPAPAFFVKEVIVVSSHDVKKDLEAGRVIGEEINEARNLMNTPGQDMTPKVLASHAASQAKKYGFTSQILGEAQMKKLGMGAVLAVGQGSVNESQFIVLEYFKGPKNQKPIVLAGKGVTFDTGGLNLKPSDSLMGMHMDMSGGADVIHIMSILSRLKTKMNIIGLIPAVENMPSGSSYRPGDIIKTMSGKTIEVINTDAEGRVILSDALHYSRKYNPALVIDIATLTGAAMIALGHGANALFTTTPELEEDFRNAGERTGDYVWPLPLWEEYENDVRGTFGDVTNLGKHGRMGGAMSGAVFLWQFIKDIPWVHVDIAPRMESFDGQYLAKGATGAGIYLVIDYILRTGK